MQINYYYSETLTSDPEGSLVSLCDDCAEECAPFIEFAGEGDAETTCEMCHFTLKDTLEDVVLEEVKKARQRFEQENQPHEYLPTEQH